MKAKSKNSRYRTWHNFGFIAFINLFLLLKIGFEFQQSNITNFYLPDALNFPKPSHYYSSAISQIILIKLLGIKSLNGWIYFHILVTELFLLFLLLYLFFNRKKTFLEIFFISSLPPITSLFLEVGKYDVFTIIGAFLCFYSTNKIGVYFGISLMATSNPEQAFIASFLLFLLSKIESFSTYRNKSKLMLKCSLFILLAVNFYLYINNVKASRLLLYPYYFFDSIGNFALNPFTNFIVILGTYLPLIMYLYFFHFLSNKKYLIFSVIIPFTLSISTYDSRRVFSLVSIFLILANSEFLFSKLTIFKKNLRDSLIYLIILYPSTFQWTPYGNLFLNYFEHFAHQIKFFFENFS